MKSKALSLATSSDPSASGIARVSHVMMPSWLRAGAVSAGWPSRRTKRVQGEHARAPADGISIRRTSGISPRWHLARRASPLLRVLEIT